MKILVIAEHNNSELRSATAATVTAAQQMGGDIHILVAGKACRPVAEAAAAIAGVEKVLLSQTDYLEHQLAEDVAPIVTTIADGYDAILAPATTTGKNLIPRIAALLDVQPVSDVISVESPTQFKRPIYAGNVIATVECRDTKKVLTVRATAFDKAGGGGSAEIEPLSAPPAASGLTEYVSEELAATDRPELTSAQVVIAGGRGLKDGENFKLLYELADKMGAAVGASRAAVDAGYVANDMQVGQTGKIVAPDLYMAFGISGAIQHLAGMKDSKIIVAVNSDADAPIFQVADYGLVADLFEVIPELTQKISP